MWLHCLGRCLSMTPYRPATPPGVRNFSASCRQWARALAAGEAHWHVLLRARAIENQAFVIAAAQAGKHNAKRESYGHALVVSPWGEIIAEVTGCTHPSIAVAEIDLGVLDRVRTRMPVQQHRNEGLHAVAKTVVHKSVKRSS
jgi:predicted amidohydrolase